MEITSRKNPLIKEIKGLSRRKNREEMGLFLVEGIKLIEEAIDYSMSIKYIFYTDSIKNIKGGEEILLRISSLNDIELILVSDEVFKDISDTKSPQGILGVLEQRYEKIEDLDIENMKKTLYLDGIQDPGNMGTIIRTADAFGFDCIFIKSGTVDPFGPKVVRATMGSIYRVPIYYLNDHIYELKKLKKQGYILYSTYLDGSTPIKDVDYNNRFIITIGNESLGVSDEVIEISDELIKIPMEGNAESLNAAIASSIIMYEASRT